MKNRKTKAVLLMLLSTLCFSLMQIVVRISAAEIGTFQQVFFRNLISLFIVGALIQKKGLSFFGTKTFQLPLFARSLAGFAGVIMLFFATANARQVDIALLNRTSPIWVSIFAMLFLKEKLTKIQIPVIVLCLLGAVIAMQPSFDSNLLPMLLALLSAVTSGIAYTMIAFCKGSVNPLTVIFHFSAVSTAGGFLLMLPSFVWPGPDVLLMLILIGVFAAGGQITLTYAYQLAPASEVAIYDYLGIITSAVLGYVILDEGLEITTVIGAILIVGGALWTYFYNRRQG